MAEYEKKPLWQWLLIYLLVGGLAYGAIYFFWMKPKGDYSGVAPTYIDESGDTSMVASEMSVTLSPINESGETGTATLSEVEGKVTVTVAMSGYPDDGVPQPAHIHVGECPEVGEVAYPLTPLENGESITELDVTLDQIKGELPLAINVHKSADEADVYTACGPLQ